jgi:hypothetical protein
MAVQGEHGGSSAQWNGERSSMDRCRWSGKAPSLASGFIGVAIRPFGDGCREKRSSPCEGSNAGTFEWHRKAQCRRGATGRGDATGTRQRVPLPRGCCNTAHILRIPKNGIGLHHPGLRSELGGILAGQLMLTSRPLECRSFSETHRCDRNMRAGGFHRWDRPRG